MKCKDVMTKSVEWVGPQDTVVNAARIMRDHNLGFLPVCDEKSRVIGVLTDRDVALRVVAEDLAADETKVFEVMSTPVVTCQPDNSLRDAERLMEELEVARVVVVDHKNVIHGVVSLADVAKRELGPLALRIARKIVSRETPDRSRGKPHRVYKTEKRVGAKPDERDRWTPPSGSGRRSPVRRMNEFGG